MASKKIDEEAERIRDLLNNYSKKVEEKNDNNNVNFEKGF